MARVHSLPPHAPSEGAQVCRCDPCSVRLIAQIRKWWAMTGSNRRHLPCKGSALPTELIARAHAKRAHAKCARQGQARADMETSGRMATAPGRTMAARTRPQGSARSKGECAAIAASLSLFVPAYSGASSSTRRSDPRVGRIAGSLPPRGARGCHDGAVQVDSNGLESTISPFPHDSILPCAALPPVPPR